MSRIEALRRINYPSRESWLRAAGLSGTLGSLVASGRRALTADVRRRLADVGNVPEEDVLDLLKITSKGGSR